jgi:hypothetical protein
LPSLLRAQGGAQRHLDSDEAIQKAEEELDCFASLAMTYSRSVSDTF